MVNSTLVDVIWHQRDLINVSANILESQIPEHLPVFFHGVLLYSDPINRHLGVIRVDDKRDFRKLQKEIQDFYQKNFASWQVELSEIAPQIYYVAKIGDNYYRCQVCNTKEKAGQFFVLVLLVDFGMFKKVLAQNLFNLNEEFVVGEWETARALCCTLPDDVTMFELKLPNYAVFKTEIEERAPVEVIILSFSNEQPQPCLAVVGSCMPDAFNTLNIDNYFLDKESRLFWMLKYLRGEHELTEIPWNDEIILQGDIHLNYAIQSSELTTDWSNVVLVKSKSADDIFVRTIASSLRLAFMQDLLNEQYSVINIKSMSFEKNQLKLGLPVVALHPDTNRLFRAQINWVSGDHNTVNVIGIDNPTFDFTMNYFQVYQLDQMFLVAPEVEHITLQSAKEITESWQHMNELINPGDVIKVQRLPRSNKTRLLFLDKEDKEEKDIANTLNKLNINASIFKPKSAVHKPEIEIADTKTDNNAVRNDSYKLETVADHMFADGGLDYLTNFKNIYSPPMRKSLNGLDLYNRFDHTKPNVISPSKHTVIRSPKSVKFNLEKIIVEMSPTQLNGMRPSRLMST